MLSASGAFKFCDDSKLEYAFRKSVIAESQGIETQSRYSAGLSGTGQSGLFQQPSEVLGSRHHSLKFIVRKT